MRSEIILGFTTKTKRLLAIQKAYIGALLLLINVTLPGVVLITTQRAEAASPPFAGDGLLLAAGEHASVTTATTGNNTTSNNGTEWYFSNNNSMGFAPGGATVDLDSADVSSDNPAVDAYRLSWHLGSGFILDDGWRVGTDTWVGGDAARYIYQANTLPSYYPSGPQAGISPATVTGGGWTLCYSGTYDESGVDMQDLFANTCTGNYLMYAGTTTPQNLLDVTRNNQSILGGPGNGQEDDLYTGDTINFKLYQSDGVTPVNWNHYRVYVSNCLITECDPDDPLEDGEQWDGGTHVTNGQYVLTESHANRWVYVYQADDSTGEAIDGIDRVMLRVYPEPEEYLASTCQELQDATTATHNSIIKLAKDIDCAGFEGFQPLYWDQDFSGVFDGQGYSISNLTTDVEYDSGLFDYAERATFKDVTLINSVAKSAYDYAGALIADTEDSVITNVHVINPTVQTGIESNDDGYAGGLVGFYEATRSGQNITLENLSVRGGTVTGSDDVGGMFGEMENDEGGSLTFRRAYATANVVGTGSDGYSNYGGLIGDLEAFAEDDDEIATITIEDVYAWGNVSGDESAGGLIGDIEAYNDEYDDAVASVTIRRAYASGNVEAAYDAGGLVGNIEGLYYEGESITIEDSFAAGTVVAESDAGGFAGIIDEGDINVEFDNNYFDTNDDSLACSADGDLDECTGINESAQTGYFKNNTSSAPLNQWDFDEVWITTAAYPVLRGMSESGSVSLTSAEDGTLITLSQTGCAAITSASTAKESALSIKDVGFDYPLGFVGFSLIGCGSGGSATVTVTFTGSFNPNSVFARKYNPNNSSFTTINGASMAKTTLNGNEALQIVYSIVDGGELDQDGAANGTIVDPVGLATQALGSPNTGLRLEN